MTNDNLVNALNGVAKQQRSARYFETGATRDVDDSKHDFEAFLSPTVLRYYAAYMHDKRVQSDGKLRDGDNWQKGIPFDSYMKSLFRHFMDAWTLHRGHEVLDFDGNDVEMEQALCAMLFNVMGYLHELLKIAESETW